MFAVKLAETAAELDAAYRVRHQVLVEEDGKAVPAAAHGRIVDRFDGLPGVVSLIALHDGRVVGTTRIMLDRGAGNAPDEHVDFAPLLPASVRGSHAHLGAVSWLTVLREARSVPRLSIALMAQGARWAIEAGLTHLKIVANPEVVPLFDSIGFMRLGGEIHAPSLGLPVVAMLLELDTLRGRVGQLMRRHQISHPLTGFERRFLADGDAVGGPPGGLTVVVAGTVLVKDEQGNTVARRREGELLVNHHAQALIAEGEVDLMVVSGASFEAQVAARPSIATQLVTALAMR